MRLLLTVAVMTAMAALGLAPPALADGRSRTWHVKATADPGGDGSRSAPLASLRRVERRSRRGDRIVVLRSPRSAPPLDGGIRLKPRQRFVGAGQAVRSGMRGGRAPRIENTTARLSGDAVRLADRTTVRNLVIVRARRGGVYGRNVAGVAVRGNDVSRHNRSCTPGFHIPPFNVPTTVPGVGIPISDGLRNGWAGIMVDASRGRGRVALRDNRVHHSDCGDGIDVRLSGKARLRARMAGNVVHDLRQGEEFDSLLAIGLQTTDRSRLVASLNRNRQTDLGNPEEPSAGPLGGDTEGVFINPVGPSRMAVTINRNAYRNPRELGGFSANGMEFVSMGDGARASVVIRNSRFARTPGDVLEQLGLGTNARLRLKLVDVVATRSTGHADSGFGNTVLIPGNNGDCLLAASGGAGNTIKTTVRRSRFTRCANNGLTFGSAVANGRGPTTRLALDVRGSRITGNRGANLRVGNETGLRELSVRVERTDLGHSRGTGSGVANASFEDLGHTRRSAIDLGGGGLGSAGHNCLDGGNLAMTVVRYDVTAERNWWGTPGGPAPGRTVAPPGSLDHSPSLAAPPAACR